MKSNKLSLIVVFAALAVGCDGQSAKQNLQVDEKSQIAKTTMPVIEVDASTPDRAIKSYWLLLDKLRSDYHNNYNSHLPTILRQQEAMAKMMTGAAYDGIKAKSDALELFSREILDVKVESESRAVIIAKIKNSTPIPVGAEVSKLQEQSRSEGDKYKYVLEKANFGWQVAEIWDFKTYTSPSGWSKIIPGDGKPYASSETYEGR